MAREKAVKEWKRAWKLELIENDNPTCRDLHAEDSRLVGEENV